MAEESNACLGLAMERSDYDNVCAEIMSTRHPFFTLLDTSLK